MKVSLHGLRVVVFRAALCAAAVVALVCGRASVAQAQGPVPGRNINMVAGTQWPDGDPFLQRQNEPSLAASTRNPFHLLAGANDYRTVDLAAVLGEETGDAWLGAFKSFDGGLTWRSTLLPGCPQSVPQCDGAPQIKGFQAGADPTVRAGTNGLFYYAGLAFNRSNTSPPGPVPSAVFVARFLDLNNKENGDPIPFAGTSVVARGALPEFLDKPSLAVDIPRGPHERDDDDPDGDAHTCSITVPGPGGGTITQTFPGGNVYVAYTSFPGGPGDQTHANLFFSRSTDCGATWSAPLSISGDIQISQGSTIAIDPNKGTVYVAWRQFAAGDQPDAIVIARSKNGGRSFTPPKPVSVFVPFDESTTPSRFRTNAYPALAVDAQRRVYVAFSAREVGPGDDARIVVTTSLNRGRIWSPPVAVDNPAQDPTGNPAGFFPPPSVAVRRYALDDTERQDSRVAALYRERVVPSPRVPAHGPRVPARGISTLPLA